MKNENIFKQTTTWPLTQTDTEISNVMFYLRSTSKDAFSAMPHWIAAVSGMPFPILCYCFSFCFCFWHCDDDDQSYLTNPWWNLIPHMFQDGSLSLPKYLLLLLSTFRDQWLIWLKYLDVWSQHKQMADPSGTLFNKGCIQFNYAWLWDLRPLESSRRRCFAMARQPCCKVIADLAKMINAPATWPLTPQGDSSRIYNIE